MIGNVAMISNAARRRSTGGSARARRWRYGASLTLLVLGMFTVALPARGQSPSATPAEKDARSETETLDEQLLKNLDNELLDGLDEIRENHQARPDDPVQKTNPVKNGEDASERDESEKTESAGDDLSQNESSEELTGDPLSQIGQRMRVVEKLLKKTSLVEQTVETQREIVDQIAQLIEQLEQQQQQSQSQSKTQDKESPEEKTKRQLVKQPLPLPHSKNGGKGITSGTESSEKLRRHAPGRPDQQQMRGFMKDVWGQLPPHAREEMLQTSPEHFVPKYELLLEKYYQRLAEEENQDR